MHGFFDQPKCVIADLVASEIHRSAALVLFGSQTPVGMVGEELRTQKIVAMIIIHTERQQRFTPATFRFGQHDRVRIDSVVKERLHVFKPLLF